MLCKLWSFVREAIGTNREAIRVHVDIPYLRKPPNYSTFMFLLLLFIFYYSVGDLQCCIHFRYTAK